MKVEEHGIELPEEIYAFELLASANLTMQQESLANTTVPVLTYTAMKEQIKKVVSNTGGETHDGQSMMKVKEESDIYHSEESQRTTFFESSLSHLDEGEYMMHAASPEQSTYYGGRGMSFRGGRGQGGYRPRGSYSRASNPQYKNQGGYSRSNNERGYPGRGGGYDSSNPTDQYGNHFTCHICKSIHHFANICPQRSQYYSETVEHVALFQNMPPKKALNSLMEFTAGTTSVQQF